MLSYHHNNKPLVPPTGGRPSATGTATTTSQKTKYNRRATQNQAQLKPAHLILLDAKYLQLTTIRPGKMGALAPLELKSIKTCEALGAREDLKTIVHDIKPQGSYSRTHCRGVFQQDGNGLILVVSGYICSTPGRARRIS